MTEPSLLLGEPLVVPRSARRNTTAAVILTLLVGFVGAVLVSRGMGSWEDGQLTEATEAVAWTPPNMQPRTQSSMNSLRSTGPMQSAVAWPLGQSQRMVQAAAEPPKKMTRRELLRPGIIENRNQLRVVEISSIIGAWFLFGKEGEKSRVWKFLRGEKNPGWKPGGYRGEKFVNDIIPPIGGKAPLPPEKLKPPKAAKKEEAPKEKAEEKKEE